MLEISQIIVAQFPLQTCASSRLNVLSYVHNFLFKLRKKRIMGVEKKVKSFSKNFFT